VLRWEGWEMAAGTPLTLIPLPPLGGEGTLTESALLPIGTLAPHANVWRGERAG